MEKRGNKIQSTEVLDLVKAGLYIYGGYKIISMVNKIGKDNTTGGGEGTAHLDCNIEDLDNLTKPVAQYKILADAIDAAVWGGFFGQFTEADQAIANALMQVNTDDDVEMLICTYGVRGKGVVIQEHFNLPQTVQKYLDAGWKDVVNEDYQHKMINVYWP